LDGREALTDRYATCSPETPTRGSLQAGT
jgi:hypothetical protein